MNDFSLNALAFNCALIVFEKLDMRRVPHVWFAWQQHSRWQLFVNKDSAPAHRACLTVDLLHKAVLDFILPELWPPCSSDLNPVDYRIWGCMQECVSQYMTWLN